MPTPLAISVLALLRERPMHPYEMHQLLLERHLDEFIKVRAGSLYHTVGRLEREGRVERTGTQREGNRPERTTYRLTPAGEVAVRGWVLDRLANPVREYPVYPYALTEAHNLTAQEAVGALSQRCERLAAELIRALGLLETDKPMVYRIGGQLRVALIEAELDWTRDLIGRIERKDFPWDPWK